LSEQKNTVKEIPLAGLKFESTKASSLILASDRGASWMQHSTPNPIKLIQAQWARRAGVFGRDHERDYEPD
jgi:hypothetical protein